MHEARKPLNRLGVLRVTAIVIAIEDLLDVVDHLWNHVFFAERSPSHPTRNAFDIATALLLPFCSSKGDWQCRITAVQISDIERECVAG
jgi:hypothetical protein